MLVELIVGNYDIKYGLVNGVDGLFMFYTLLEIDIVWKYFQYPLWMPTNGILVYYLDISWSETYIKSVVKTILTEKREYHIRKIIDIDNMC